MKKLLQFFLVLGVSSVALCQTTLIPDPNFEQALIDLGYDTPPINGSVPTVNINNVTILDLIGLGISDLTGIEDFGALEFLDCKFNALTSLDVSHNTSLLWLWCADNQLTSLDVSNNPLLFSIDCSSNQIRSLDVSNNPLLEWGMICDNNQITSLDVSNNPVLRNVICHSNELTSLDLRNGNNTNIDVANYDSRDNPNLTCIYVDDTAYSAQYWTNIDLNSTFVENEAECSELSVEDNRSGIGWIVYPNPTNDYLYINGITSPLSATVYNIVGQRVLFTENTDKIEVSELSEGVYVVMVSDGLNETLEKFIKI